MARSDGTLRWHVPNVSSPQVRRLEGEISAGQNEYAKMDGMLISVSKRANDTKAQLADNKYYKIDAKHRKKVRRHRSRAKHVLLPPPSSRPRGGRSTRACCFGFVRATVRPPLCQLIEFKTTQMLVGDLERYYSALDRALMKFHSTKMEDINKQV